MTTLEQGAARSVWKDNQIKKCMERSELGGPSRKLFHFVSCVRARGAYVRSDPGEKVSLGTFPFPFSPWEIFPFPLREKEKERESESEGERERERKKEREREKEREPFPPPPNLLSSFSWLYRYPQD